MVCVCGEGCSVHVCIQEIEYVCVVCVCGKGCSVVCVLQCACVYTGNIICVCGMCCSVHVCIQEI